MFAVLFRQKTSRVLKRDGGQNVKSCIRYNKRFIVSTLSPFQIHKVKISYLGLDFPWGL
jgi:hypothetical protein